MKTRVFAVVLVCCARAALAQTNTFPTSGNVGIGTTSPGAALHVKTDGTFHPWIALDKSDGQEEGFQFRKSGTVMFYLYSDNADDDALKFQSTSLPGEGDGTPRIQIPFNNHDLYLTTSGGNVAIGHKSPAYRLDVLGPANDWKARFAGPDGYITIGPANPYWAHIYTDRPAFLFNQNVYSYMGGFSSYSPADLSLQTNGTPRITVSNATGNVGIGTETPQAKLHIVNGDLLLQNQSSGYPILWLKDVSGANNIRVDYNSIIGAGGNLTIRSQNALVLNDAGGNVGIGTNSPNEKLTVNGTIYGKEVKVDLSVPGPDYVFEESYDLPTLEEIKTYIDAHKHLPDVPSANEMKADGIKLAEMNMILLKKVEELTLYIMQQQQEIEKLKKTVYEKK